MYRMAHGWRYIYQTLFFCECPSSCCARFGALLYAIAMNPFLFYFMGPLRVSKNPDFCFLFCIVLFISFLSVVFALFSISCSRVVGSLDMIFSCPADDVLYLIGKRVYNSARGQVNRINGYSPVLIRAWEFGLARRV